MPIATVQVRNYRSISDSGVLELGPITLVLGENNAGKSSLLHAVYMIQSGGRTGADDIRLGADQASVRLGLSSPVPDAITGALKREGQLRGEQPSMLTAFRDHETDAVSVEWPAGTQIESRPLNIPAQRPDHLIAPFFSRRKSAQYETVARRDL
ncbi:AAA family ATPase, partial [Microbacterium sp.]|uniref:AAA family ATPase n=1 Tax=Microbacterium sp. TaxID=51671 RepID=UPI0027335318